ncbi:Rieske 2Fe-2S domain-containing protein [Okeania sp.]|uniref:aromatic ring-hydroxylating dioxygenase subunit alpha n=1 Tax=Okeania sp. TaxID=3100323 RepID=UPI002B4B0126|nr:Rieske 2Fe-2S domain-containing protein [Okeania sp.]MEB3342888.1 Rieske 2Fe-2S domain-containing protein [Okeania sp.]
MQTEFNFFQHWYPLSPVEDLDPEIPVPVTLLGMRLVIWKPRYSENYQVFLDVCPHRLAPLSEGRVDEKTGNLMCSYHGWQFDSDGICTHIPQAENKQIIEKNRQNFCVTALPVQEKNDLLWVWPDAKTAELAATTPLPLSPQIDAEKGFVWSSYVRDLEYDWEILVENVADPSHVPFSHHGVQGNRNKAIPIPMEILQSTIDLIEVSISRKDLPTKITFEPPCHLEYAISIGSAEKKLGLVTYCLPVSPGKSRIVAQFTRNFAKTIHRLTPRWWDHIGERSLILDGDMVLLNQQEYLLKQKQSSESWKIAYNLPTTADRLVIEYRNWFDKYCGGKLPWNEVGVSDVNNSLINNNHAVLLDRYQQHTQHCSSCRQTLKNLQRLQFLLVIYFIVIVSGVSVFPDSLRMQIGLPLVITALLGMGIYGWLKMWLIPQFYFVDYIHAKK